MGNGVGIEANVKGNPNKRYEKLEKICRAGHFHQEHGLFVEALEEATRLDSLDCLELLLVSGNTRKAQPLHLACAAAKLESVELMLSAGFSGDLVNREGRTPLHMCCITINPEAGLCGSLLGLRFPKSIKTYDYMGQTPIHFAASVDNVYVVKALVQIDERLIKLPDQSGKTAYQVAKLKHNSKCVDFLEFSAKNLSTQKKNTSSTSVDQNRIMEVWERFFENAFKFAGGMMGDEEDESDCYCDIYCNPSQKQNTQQSHQIQTNRIVTSSVDDDYSTCNEDDWFYWVICYDRDIMRDYYIVNRWTLETQWLTEFLQQIYETRSYPFVFSDFAVAEQHRYPQSLQEARDWGWLTYYDEVENYCQWMNVVTNVFEMFLPVGMSDIPAHWQWLHVVPSQDDEEWYEADQYCSYAWILVVADDECNYYMNTITGHTSWDPPPRWMEIVGSWNNWILCCTEDNTNLKFW
jgi:hypothetical protein